MSTWVLIVVAWASTGNVGGGFHVDSVPGFSSRLTCEAAAQIVLKKARGDYSPTAECTPQ